MKFCFPFQGACRWLVPVVVGTLFLTACDKSQQESLNREVKHLIAASHKLSEQHEGHARSHSRHVSHPSARHGTEPETTEKDISVHLVSRSSEVGHRNFVNAKKVLPRVYVGLQQDIYCGCDYTGKRMDLQSCGYSPRKNLKRAERLEWEHVVPANHLGGQRQCWQKGGRKACSGHDPVFDMMEGDLNNLTPSVGEVNGDRSNMSYGVWARNPRHVYGQCSSVPDFKTRIFQPREAVRGRLARISLYMYTRYKLRLSGQNRKLWCAWAKEHPVDAWERKRNTRIISIQGEGNPIVNDPARLKQVCG